MLTKPQLARKTSPGIVYPLVFILSFLLCLSWVSAKEEQKPNLQEWQIHGIVAALGDEHDKVKELAFDKLAEYQPKDLKTVLKNQEEIAQPVANILNNEQVNWDVRGRAAVVLGNLGEAATPYVADILQFLQDDKVDSEVRSSAAVALGNLGQTVVPYLPDIAKIFHDEQVDSDVRRSAVVALGNLGQSAAPYLPEIANIFQDEKVDSEVRRSAALALGNLGQRAAPYVGDILQFLQDEKVDFAVRRSAALALGNLGEAAAPYVGDILNFLKDEKVDANVRRRAAVALGNLGEKVTPYVGEILQFLQDDKVDSAVRRRVAMVLGNLGQAVVPYLPEIAKILKDEKVDADVRGNAAKALGKFGQAGAPYVGDILNFLQDETVDADIRDSAAQALEKLGQAAAPYVPDILNFLQNEKIDAAVRSTAAKALGKLGSAATPYMLDILDFLQNEKVHYSVRSSATLALSKLGQTLAPYVPDITNILQNEKVDADVRGNAALVLGKLDHAATPYVSDIAHILQDEKVNAAVRGSTAQALGNLGEAAAPYFPDILKFLQNEKVDAAVRSSAAEALGKLNHAAAPYLPEILKFLQNEKFDSAVRSSAALVLENLGTRVAPYIPNIINILKDEKVDLIVRRSAAVTLGKLGQAAEPYLPNILDFLKDQKVDLIVRRSAAVTLGSIRKLELAEVVAVLNFVYYEPKQENFSSDVKNYEYWRFLTYFLSGGDEQVKILLQWLGKPQTIPRHIKYEAGKKTLEVFYVAWQPSQDLKELRQDLAKQIAVVAQQVSWQSKDLTLLQNHYYNLEGSHNEANAVHSVILNLEGWQWFFLVRNTIIIHLTFWLALIFAYPKFPQIQAIFFWNPWVRRILGLGYVGFFLTWFPPLRRQLFVPFKPLLLADALLDNFHHQTYFSQSRVKLPGTDDILPITQAIPSIQGQIILEGDSGLGKSMFLRHLLTTSQRIVVFLPAHKCNQGVIAAIQQKLQGKAPDGDFLKNLIYSGAIDICIDGLNEVTADTRAKIAQFVENYFQGNIIITTQPLKWTPPATAKTYQLQPLEPAQIQEFLLSYQPQLPKDDLVKGINYTKACTEYLTTALNPQQTTEELEATLGILSNPMDLTVLALIISQGKQPNLFHLQQQQYNLMADEYLQEWKQEFPLKRFSQAVYQMRLANKQALRADEFYQVVMSLEDERYQMVISRQWQDEKGESKGEWYFRHDKIMDFFLVQNFLGDSPQTKHILIDNMGDSRFRGVYFLLANLLPKAAAQELREKLIQYAADTKDHTVSDTFVQLLRTR